MHREIRELLARAFAVSDIDGEMMTALASSRPRTAERGGRTPLLSPPRIRLYLADGGDRGTATPCSPDWGRGDHLQDGDGYRTVFWPQSGEYLNTTNFLTDEEFERRLELHALAERVDELALLTDGLQMLALRYADKSVHSPFFLPMFQALLRR